MFKNKFEEDKRAKILMWQAFNTEEDLDVDEDSIEIPDNNEAPLLVNT